jgi:CBS domain containing-hemolysin-like protein
MKRNLFRKKKKTELEKIIGEDGSTIKEEEKEMIRGIVELGETAVKSIMIPRTDVVAADVDLPFKEIVSLIVKTGHSRVPVYERTIDNVIGFFYAKDLLAALLKRSDSVDVRKFLRPVHFVPEGKMVDELLKDFRQKRVHIAVVVDEYGGMAGIVCLEDVLEQIVGEIQDEYDDEEEYIKRIGPGSFLCDARTAVEDINDVLGVSLPSDSSDTVGGFVFNLFGKVPKTGDTIAYESVMFTIEKMEGRKLKEIAVTLQPAPKPGGGEPGHRR